MYAAVSSCLRCKQSKLNYHDLYLSQNGIDLERRIDELTSPYKPKYAPPIFSVLIILGIATSIAGWHEYCYHPNGYVRQTANAYLDVKQDKKVAAGPKASKTL